MQETRFWVLHRRLAYGPFDYQWSGDLDGIEFTFRGEKYGECCSSEEFFADLKPYALPHNVVAVATIVTGTIVRCIFQGISDVYRVEMIETQLIKSGYDRYQLQRLP